jgi:hypothetical protein
MTLYDPFGHRSGRKGPRAKRPTDLGSGLGNGLGGALNQSLLSPSSNAASSQTRGNPDTLAILAARRGDVGSGRGSPTPGAGLQDGTQPFIDRIKAREEDAERQRADQRARRKAEADRRAKEQRARRENTLRAQQTHTPARPPSTQPSTQSGARPAAQPNATAEEADGFLRSVMSDNRYWEPNPLQDTIRDGVQALFQVAYPGKGRLDATGRAIQPDRAAVSLQTLEDEAARRLPEGFLPRQPERPSIDGGFNPTPRTYPDWVQGRLMRAWYDTHIRPTLQGRTIQEPVLSFTPDPKRPLADQVGAVLSAAGTAPLAVRDASLSGRRVTTRTMEIPPEQLDSPNPRPDSHHPDEGTAHAILLNAEVPTDAQHGAPPPPPASGTMTARPSKAEVVTTV